MEIGPRVRDGRRKPSDEDTIKALAESYKAGASIRQLMVETGWSYGTVYQRLSMAQTSGLLVLRPRGGVVGRRRAG
jgi:transposase